MYLLTITAGVGYDKDGNSLSLLAKKLGKVRSFMAKRFGGYTEKPVAGGWIDNKKSLIVEPGMQWQIMFDSQTDNQADNSGHHVASYVRKVLNQSAVMYYVRPVMGGFAE